MATNGLLQLGLGNLVSIGDEEITVSATSIGPTASEVTDNVKMAVFQVVASGNQDLRSRMNADPVAGGGNGELFHTVADLPIWEVWGHDNVLNFKMIKTGGTDHTVAIVYFGSGG